MSIEKITSKIMDDARQSADVLMKEAKSQCDAILDEASGKAEEIEKKAIVKGEDEKEKLISRRKAVADIDGRKIILEAKQQLISQCFDEAAEKIAVMDKKDYMAFIAANVKNTGAVRGELILNEKDSKAIGGDMIKLLSKEIPGSSITLSEETRDIKGGFLLRDGAVYINGTVEALTEEIREEITGEVAKQLFG